jgi:succinyl-diaminopimelate desuccinylase
MLDENFRILDERITGYREDMIALISKMIEIKAISPISGGMGESERASMLEDTLKQWGFRPERYDYSDETGSRRSNLVVKIGSEERTLWIVAHIDTVSEGNLSLWKSDPFKAKIEGDRIYGRGTQDNGQGVISGMFALKALKDTGTKLRFNMGLALVADEELGSRYGIQKLIEEGIFRKDDLVLVPDWGSAKGDKIEIAEKGMLWLKISVLGKQTHASTPEKGVNAYMQSIRFLNRVDKMLHEKYNASNAIFDPPVSTFEMTKHEKNIDSINIIPSLEVSYLDCRILPEYDISLVIRDIREVAAMGEFSDVEIKIEEFNREDATPQTEEGSEVVQILKYALKRLRGLDSEVVGIGGGTCAAFFRKKGIQTAVWSTGESVAHEPNEYVELSNIEDDSKVFAYIAAAKDVPS